MRSEDGSELLPVWRQPVNDRLLAARNREQALMMVAQAFPEATVWEWQLSIVMGVGAKGEPRWLGGSQE